MIKIKPIGIRIESRENQSSILKVFSLVVAILAALAVGAVMIYLWGADVGMAFSALFSGAFGDSRSDYRYAN